MLHGNILTTDFFEQKTNTVARDLLGQNLCLKNKTGGILRLPITETEAYLGPHDLACHSSKGKTKRTEVMYGPPGTIYVYLIYGMYHMLNIVTEEIEYPSAVLIRGAGKYDGPGKLTRALGIDKNYNGLMQGKESGLWIESVITSMQSRKNIVTTPRIGVAYAGEWAQKELRFVLR